MTIDALRSAREATPFRPFTIHLAGGRSHYVPHRDYVSMSPTGRTVIVYTNGDAYSTLDLLLVNELTFDEQAVRTAGNGSA